MQDNELNQKLPIVGAVLNNSEISNWFSVGYMGGMRRSIKRNLLVLVSDPFKGIYEDRWEGNVLHYTGMGTSGDQSLSSQNKTLADSLNSGIAIRLLEAFEQYKYTYLGEVKLVSDPYQETQFDDQENKRQVWMFPISLVAGQSAPSRTLAQTREIENVHSKAASVLSNAQLKARAENSRIVPVIRVAETTTYIRDLAVAEYAKRLAKGVCDLCQIASPFKTKQGMPYLECHHVVWLARGGEDTIGNTVALCPNCHRRMHVLDLKSDKDILLRRINSREPISSK